MSVFDQFSELMSERYGPSSRSDSEDDRTHAALVRVIEEQCREYLVRNDDELVFEVTDKVKPQMLSVLQDKRLTNMYEFEQVGMYQYKARKKLFQI
jgi:hypothetical protein